MSYLALARKWRPRSFCQLLGQSHINQALIKSLDQQRIHHAYLFTGTRGVGKTSIARLMAKALNCEGGISSEPCLTCSACLSIEGGNFVDLIEIDGASKTRVEDTRELLENIAYAPSSGRFKIYLIDEVHMLSQHSFNALLKTLEEPPQHVKFLLATTDPQKLPVTVLSRCLQFNLKHLSIDVIVTQLTTILEEEQFSFEPEALTLLAKAASGSMRDALSLLDQAIASADTLTIAVVKSILGYSQQDYALHLLQCLAAQNAEQLIDICRNIAKEGGYFSYVLNEILTYLHQVTLFRYIPNDPLMGFTEDIKYLAEQLSAEDLQLFYQMALKGIEELALAPVQAIGFEMIMLRMLTFRPVTTTITPPLMHEHKSTKIEEIPALPKISVDLKPKSAVEPLAIATVIACEVSVPANPIIPIPKTNNSSDWGTILSQLKLSGLAQTAAENAELASIVDNEVTLKVAKGHQSLFTPTIVQRIEAALTLYLNKKTTLVLMLNDGTTSSPAQQKRVKSELDLKQAQANLNDDPFFQQLKHEFSAEIVKNSIEPI